MFLFDSLYPASFKGASFFYVAGDIDAGRKTVTHEYPNKNFRFIEDLGLNLRKFSIRGIISGFGYEDNKALLEDALNSEGIGILVHPFLGRVNCVCTGYTVSEDLTATGVANYTMSFSEANESIYPDASEDNTSQIADLYRELYEYIADDLNGQYFIDTVRNQSSAADRLREISATLEAIAASVFTLDENNESFQKDLLKFSANAYKISAEDGDIGGNLSNVISKFDGLSLDGQERFDASSKLLGFGSDDIFSTVPTREIIQRNTNLKLINGTVNALAFTNMVDAAKDITYQDENDLNATADVLADAYDFLFNSTTDQFSNQLIDYIAKVRNQSRIFFEQERLTVNKIVEIETKKIPMAVLAFNYYGNTDNYDELLSLNTNFNPAQTQGTVKILEV